MDKQVVAVMHSLDQKEGVMRELEIKGVKEEAVQIIHRDDDEASEYRKFFEQGDYVVLVEVDKELGKIPVEQEDTLSEHRTPKGHHHQPHHQMKQGM
ncbi:hypothetical protein [Salisediminibacterium selenitireducens]|uniref:Uncharacterized protein n=1 Tax=Bacillus selenitireducens (strain ATCC 700615 / DSM 15326 / MLS10) TaxID=439292 RepID=D6XYP9_BACIE|nr:hypothetical protein [Salisediminibacterium selenitireducens]ADH98207.1 hypothetical protein Bsel_0672 [[Bacillus] selenitireducens MLS10]